MHTPEPLHLPPLDRNVRHKSHIKFRSTPLFIDTPNSHSKLRLLSKHIKTNEISQIIGSSHLSTTNLKGDIEVADAEKRESEANITLLKKKINETRDMYNRKEQEMNRLKDEVDKLKGDEGFSVASFSKGHNKLDQLKRALELQKLKLEEALASKNTYESILDRTKKDKLVDQVKAWKIEKELTSKSKAFALEFTHAVRAQQFKKQTDHVLDEVIKQVEDEDRKRQDNLYLFEKAVFAKEDAEKTREERAHRNETMAQSVAKEVAHNDEKQYQSLLLVHKFLHLFMKKQMEDEMKKHEKIELAFQRIRAAVGITDAHQFVDKFVKREEAYRELLMSIASYEKRLEGSKKHHEDLQKKILHLKEKNVALEKQRVEQKHGSDQLNETYKELREKTETARTAKIKLEQSYAWAIRILLKIDKAQQIVGPKYTEMFPRGKAGPAILHVIQAVAQHTKTLQETNYEKVLDEIDGTKIGTELTKKEFISKNMRVKRDDISPIVITTTPKSETSHTRSHSRSASRANTPYEQSPMLQKPDHIEGVEKDEEDENIELQFSIKRKEIKSKHSKHHFQVGTLQKKVLERLLEKEKEK